MTRAVKDALNLRWRKRCRRFHLCYRCAKPCYLTTRYCRAHLFANRLAVREREGWRPWAPGCRGHNSPAEVKAGLAARGFV